MENDLSLSAYTLTCSDTTLVASDYHTKKISLFSYSNLRPMYVLGRSGRGPGEFSYPSSAAAGPGKIYVSDFENDRITVLNSSNGSLDTTITGGSPSNSFLVTGNSLTVSGRYLFLSFSAVKNEVPFTRVNINNGSVKHFGEKRRQGTYSYILLIHHHTIIAVQQRNPLIKFYSERGKLLATNNLKRDPNLAGVLAYQKKFRERSRPNRFLDIFSDAAVYHNDLIINYNAWPHGKIKANQYLVYKISHHKLQKMTAFRTNIHGGYTDTFCIHNNMLYSNGGPHGFNIYVFDLSFLNNQK
ncbi:MAG TPA: hypothetical protein VE868_02970 [Balneolaceae bacterium]|nr:hypothetical protein [Balneolaceae bacterium]